MGREGGRQRVGEGDGLEKAGAYCRYAPVSGA